MRLAATKPPTTIDAYIALCEPKAQSILHRIRQTVRDAAPEAEELISYRMPAFRHGGMLVYFAAFKNHIGLFPPVRGDARLEAAVARYAGEKGNLRFPLDQPVPFALIKRIVKLRVRQLEEASTPARRTVAKQRVPRASK
jgi:uncharacterized protein YdhG (YjbR/CyaY superfamily)